jgi:hypothetical protein
MPANRNGILTSLLFYRVRPYGWIANSLIQSFFMDTHNLTEESLMSHSLDTLFTLMVEKIEEIKRLTKSHGGTDMLKHAKQDLTLIEKVINSKKQSSNI